MRSLQSSEAARSDAKTSVNSRRHSAGNLLDGCGDLRHTQAEVDRSLQVRDQIKPPTWLSHPADDEVKSVTVLVCWLSDVLNETVALQQLRQT